MNRDNDVKTTSIGFRATDKEKERVQKIADAFTSGDQSMLLRQLLCAAENALETHGAIRTVTPFELNYFPPDTITAQDIKNTKEK